MATKDNQADYLESYHDFLDETEVNRLGLMSNGTWDLDPRRLGIMLSRYKFVSKMFAGKQNVIEIGCGDAFGSRIVKQEVEQLTVADIEPRFIADVKQRNSKKWPLIPIVHDILEKPLDAKYDAAYSLDVLEHIPADQEDRFISNITSSLSSDGMVILGMPSLESQQYASPASKAGHINCKSGLDFKALCNKHFKHVFLFSMNDEVVHTGYYPMAHYLIALCIK
ncbi:MULTISPECIES: class I SAM-dependent methyltransferase [Pseudoalteromonas]|uniref:Methyltransferase type 12 n=1 Tax=Pseudoalteromonas amylolytica TaxID=1859457 RepID=A0A1S1MVF7_9GAMM|nr:MULTISPECIES: class I SAM-dependent methyltransferase [Pseudoalteromonas]OHU87560.1 methyltransferase type 12 [Pseudoalteromonas sp. JW3]OHU91003.1 methyltransferase type 12 [Pseudoalteromonas amylolytica]